MAYIDFVGANHRSTKRDYLGRVNSHDKALCAEVALEWGFDYWDGERQYGFGGYRYDGRWRSVAEAMIKHYQLADDAKILDVGCGKGFLLYEFTQLLPKATVFGIDISRYAIDNSKPEVRDRLQVGSADSLPFPDHSMDLVFSINTLHNLYVDQLWKALAEMERVGKRTDPADTPIDRPVDRHSGKYICVESYRNEHEKVNLLYWQLTCRAFYATREWEWVFQQAGYRGDHSFIYFE